MSDAHKPHSMQDDLRKLIADWEDLGPVEQERYAVGYADQAIGMLEGLFEQLDSEQRLREAAEQQYAAAEVQYGTLKEQLEAAQTAMRRARHELDQWVFADGTATYRVDRAEKILDAALNPASEPLPEKKWPAEYVNGKWEPQCPYGDMCSRCDAIGYCERAESRPAKERQ